MFHLGCFSEVHSAVYTSANSVTTASFFFLHDWQLCMRPCAMVVPDVKVIVEVILYYNGFQQYQSLASKLAIFFDLVKTQVGQGNERAWKCAMIP